MAEAITDDVIVTKAIMDPAEWGLYAMCFMQVCAYCEVPPGQIEARANELNPPGTDGRWKIVWGDDPDDPLNDDTMKPGPCAEHRDRLHYLLSC